MAYTISTFIDQETVEKRIKEMAAQISADYAGKEIRLLCILKGSVYFMSELSKYITVPVTIDFMQVSSYGAGTVSTGEIKVKKDMDESIEGENVIVIEDIIDSGYTLSYLLEMLQDRGPASLKLCTLLSKPDRRVREVAIDYLGFEIPDKFVVGYGMDVNQQYRNLPYIGVVEGV